MVLILLALPYSIKSREGFEAPCSALERKWGTDENCSGKNRSMGSNMVATKELERTAANFSRCLPFVGEQRCSLELLSAPESSSKKEVYSNRL